ncbi:MAG: hypothetical protein JWN76_916, partial [Chitinophagaceae bacterium]|nr:hypothetical protein [Chitinophagaceae bacterium]
LSTNSSSFTTGSISGTATYYAQSRNTTTGCISSTRTPVVATVSSTSLSGGQITGNQNICGNSGIPVTINSSQLASGGFGSINYFWQYSANQNFNLFTNVAGASGTSYSPGSVSVTTYLRRGAVDINKDTAYSNIITITVIRPATVNAGNNTVTEADSLQLGAQLPANTTGIWSVNNSQPAIFSDKTVANSWANLPALGIYKFTWTTTDIITGCQNSGTVEIKKLSSKLQIILSAAAPKRKLDGTYDVTYIVKIKNNGNTDLADLNLFADLDNVYVAPTQYKLIAAPIIVGNTIKPNPAFTGHSVIKLISKNSPKQPLPRISDSYDAGLNERSLSDRDEAIPEIQPETAAGNDEEYERIVDKTNTQFINSSQLAIGDSAFIYISINVTANGSFGPYPMNVTGVAQNELGSPVKDTSTDASTVRNTNVSGIKFPTVVSLIPNPVLKVIKYTLSVTKVQENLYRGLFKVFIKNEGNINLINLTLNDNLDSLITSPSTYTVEQVYQDNNKLILNPAFDGKTNINLLDQASALDVGAGGDVYLSVLIVPNTLYRGYTNLVVGSGYNSEYDMSISNFAISIDTAKQIDKYFLGNPLPPVVINHTANADNPLPPTIWKTLVTTPNNSIPAWCNPTGASCGTNSPAVPLIPGMYVQTLRSYDTLSKLFSATYVSDTIWILPVIKVKGATYISGEAGNPTTIRSLVTNLTIGSSVEWCDTNGNNCSSTAPSLPSKAGIYIWCLHAMDSASGLKSAGCTLDTVNVLPASPIVTNGFYAEGGTNNPKDISVHSKPFTTGSVLRWCDVNGNNCTTTAPALPTQAGTYVWCVKAVDNVSGLTSKACVYDTITIMSASQVFKFEKLATAPQLNTREGYFDLNYTFYLSNPRNEMLDSIFVYDDLSKVFPSPVSFQVMSLTVSGALVSNNLFDGRSQANLLSVQSKLGGLKTDSISLRLRVQPNGFEGRVENRASAAMISPSFGKLNYGSNDPTNTISSGTPKPTLTLIPLVPLKIPTGFSPNNDGINDRFVIIHPSQLSLNVQIFNRWGSKVYVSPDYKNDWDGTGNQPIQVLGQPLPAGTYYYLVETYDRATDKRQQYTGFITLTR